MKEVIKRTSSAAIFFELRALVNIQFTLGAQIRVKLHGENRCHISLENVGLERII